MKLVRSYLQLKVAALAAAVLVFAATVVGSILGASGTWAVVVGAFVVVVVALAALAAWSLSGR